MIAPDLAPLAVPTDSLELLPGNPRRGDVAAVRRSLEAFGQRKPIVARRDDRVVIAGNHTLQAARALGWAEIAVVWVDDDETTSKAFALADNRTAELGDYDEAALAELIGQVGSVDPELLVATGWDDASVKELLASLEPESLPVLGDPDDVPKSVVGKTVLGDVWVLGPHRVMCGDSLNPVNLDRLISGMTVGCVLTDPPYGINLNTDYSSGGGRSYRKVKNDDQPFDATLLRGYFSQVAEQFWWGANYYWRTLSDKDLSGSWLVWDKRDERTDSVVGSGFELCWSAQRHKQDVLRYLWTNYTSHTNEGHRREHPTEKPIQMLMEVLERWAPAKCVVVDLFGGSGSTLIAAHQTNRVAYLMELDPKYVDVICARFQKATGIKPVNEATGREHDFLDG